MKWLRTCLILGLGIVVAQPGSVFSRSRPLGTISGIVKDDQGAPINGALIKLLDQPLVGAAVRSILTDEEGKFYARNIVPGPYRLRAEARGFISSVRPVKVKPDIVLNLKFELRRLGTLVQQRTDRDAYRWVVRGVPRPVLRLNGEEASGVALASDSRQVLSRARPVRGIVQLVGGVPVNHLPSSRSYSAINFALAGEATSNLELVFVGQVASQAEYPGRLQLIASTFAGDAHHLTTSIGIAQLQGIDASSRLHRINQLSLQLADEWQILGPVVLVYGIDLSRFSGVGTQWVVSPRLGVSIAADAQTRIRADYVPVTAQEMHQQGEFNYEGGQVKFTDPQSLSFVGDAAQPDKSHRLQFALERQLGEDSSVEAAIFFDQISGRSVGLLAIPVDTSGAIGPTWHSLVQQGDARGARIMYRRQLTPFLAGVVGYAVGEGQKLSEGGLARPGNLLQSSAFHVVSLKLDTSITRTHTRLSAIYRLGSEDALFAIDPFYGNLEVFDPNLSIVLTQEIPDFGILPGDWEASVDARNLLDRQESIATDSGSVLIGQVYRTIRGSVSVRF